MKIFNCCLVVFLISGAIYVTVKLVPDQLSFADSDPGYDLKLSPGITRDCPEPRLLPATLFWQPRRET